MTDAFIRREKPGHRKIHRGEGHVKTELEVRAIHLQVKAHQDLLKAEGRRMAWDSFFLTTFKMNQCSQHLGFRPLVPRIRQNKVLLL